MSEPSDIDPAIDNLLSVEAEYPSPEIVSSAARLKDWESEYSRSIADPEGFWGDYARNFQWSQPWHTVLESDGVNHEWFIGARTNITINALDRHAASDQRDRPAFIWLPEDGPERIVTYAELHDLVCRFANGLKSLGIAKGDRVIIYMPLTIEGAVSMLGCARIGAIHSVVYAGLGSGALRDRIVDAGARLIIAGDVGYRRGKTVALKSIVDEAIDDLDFVEKVIVFRRDPATALGPRDQEFSDLLQFSPDCPAEEMDAEDPLFILYTSGTTGKPKGVVHVHGGFMVGTTYHLETFYDVGPADVFWCTSDIGWVVGHSYIVYGPLCGGVTTLFREGAIDYPNPGVAWEVVERYKVTKMFAAPTALRMFMRFGESYPAAHDITSLRVLACAGEPLNPEAWRWAQTHLVGDGRWGYVIDNWWQTELGGPTLGTLPAMPMRPGKVGKPLPGVIADVVDADGNPTPADVGGRLILKQPFPHLMRTVWNDHPRYERMWNNGCYVSGDIAVRDEDGYISVLGRADDVLKVAGHRIGTADVESALVSHPAVAEAAAIGIPDAIKGEAIKVFVQTRAGFEADDALAKTLIAHVRHELGPIATPSSVVFVAALPKTRSGKIMRRLLKAKETGVDPGDLSTLEE